MPEIRILADRVANQIAAGEVVERPASVAKELIENSIDSGAGKIEVEFRNGGKSYLRVEDDGCGMSPDQALMSLERHATSKIRKASDLNEVQTFGFRGEALPSISSVSRFTLRTRAQKNSEGNEILMNGGKLIHVKECGMPIGTRIEVSHLFNSVPVRRKFLKTEATESTHLTHLTKLYALAHPNVTFSLSEGGRTLFRSPSCEEFGDRVREIFGKSLAETLVPIEANEKGIGLSGLVGKPGYSRPTRKEMIFFVNRRPVDCKAISYAVLEAYHTFAPKGRFPPAILFVSIDPSLVDVNVHPAKREIRFRDEARIRKFVVQSLLRRNRELSGKTEMECPTIEFEKDPSSERMVPSIDPQALEMYGLDQSPKTSPSSSLELVRSMESNDHRAKDAAVAKDLATRKTVGGRGDGEAQWRFLDRPYGDLAIFSTPQGIVGMQTRAAYERVRFEQLEDALEKKASSNSQSLLLSESLELDGIDRENLEAGLDDLRDLGFALEEFGRNFFRLEGCPSWMDKEHAGKFLKDFLEVAREEGGGIRTEAFAKEALVRLSSAPNSTPQGFSDDEVIRLAQQLLSCRNPYTCPKGKPTYFEIPFRDFETRFKRKL